MKQSTKIKQERWKRFSLTETIISCCFAWFLYFAMIFRLRAVWMQYFSTFFTSFWALSLSFSLFLSSFSSFFLSFDFYALQWSTYISDDKRIDIRTSFEKSAFEFSSKKETTITEEIKWMKPKVLLIVCYTLFSSLYIYSFHFWNFVCIFDSMASNELKTVHNKSIKWFPGFRMLPTQPANNLRRSRYCWYLSHPHDFACPKR